MMWFLLVKVLFMSIAMSVSGFAVWGMTLLCRGIMSRRTAYRLWLIPMALALVPLSVNIPIAVNVSQAQYPAVIEPVVLGDAAQPTAGGVADVSAINRSNNNPVSVDGDTAIRGAVSEFAKSAVFAAKKIPLKEAAGAAYLVGVLVCLAEYLLKTARFGKKIRPHLTEFTYEYEQECCARIGYGGKVRVYRADFECSPFVFGCFRTKTVVPKGGISKEAFIHEALHIKRHDTLYMLLTAIVGAVHFFNPLFYVFARQIRKNMELACDESAAAVMDDRERLMYSREIVANAAPAFAGAACLSETGNNIKERIEKIMEKKTYSRAARFASLAVAVAVLVTQTAFAAVLGGRSPAKSYIINHTNIVYSLVYQNGDDVLWSRMSGVGSNIATLVNSPFYKGFSADLNLTFSKLRTKEGAFDSKVHIEMTKFVKEFNGGKNWQGLFSVTMGDIEVVSDAMGYLSNIPGNYARDVSRLIIDDGDIRFDLERIDFDTDSEDTINAEYEEDEANDFEAHFSRLYCGHLESTATIFGKTYSGENPDAITTLKVDDNNGKFAMEDMTLADCRYYIKSVPGGFYKFDGDKVYGKFLLMYSGGVPADEFYATVSGFYENTLSLVSDDGNIRCSIVAEDVPEDVAESVDIFGTMKGLSNGIDDNSEFAKTCVRTVKAVPLNKMPFTLRLSDDGTKVILKLKQGFAPLGWDLSYASYGGGDNDVYVKYDSSSVSDEFELPLCDTELVSHNLQFRYYTADPYVKHCYTDIMFKVWNGKIQYRSCKDYITENTGYSGNEGKSMIGKFFTDSYTGA